MRILAVSPKPINLLEQVGKDITKRGIEYQTEDKLEK